MSGLKFANRGFPDYSEINAARAEIKRLTNERDNALVEIERLLAGRGIEQMMLTNALPQLAVLGRVRELCDDAEDRRGFIAAHELRAALEATS